MPALVAHRGHGFRPVDARLVGRLLFSDEGPRRLFWLLDESAQLVYEPYGWRNEWYVDIVVITSSHRGGTPLFTVTDRHIDIVVEGSGPTYRLLDLDEAGAAMAGLELAAALSAAQRFLDRHLHRRAGTAFPPAPIRPFFQTPEMQQAPPGSGGACCSR